MNNKYKLKDKFLFFIYNLFFNSSLIYFVVLFINLTISMFFGSLYRNIDTSEDFNNSDGLTILSFFLLTSLFEIFFIIMKFISMPLIYKYSKNQFFKNFLDNLIYISVKEKMKIFFKIFIFDIIVSSIIVLIVAILLKIFFKESFQEQIFFCAGIQILFIGVFSIGGVFPCYLFFFLWYKLTHRNKTKIA